MCSGTAKYDPIEAEERGSGEVAHHGAGDVVGEAGDGGGRAN